MHEVVDVIQTNATWSMVPIRLIKGIAVVLAVMCAIVAFLMGSLTFKPLQTGDILGLFLRLIAIAIFIVFVYRVRPLHSRCLASRTNG